MSSWDFVTQPAPKPSLKARALKRSVTRLSRTAWVVAGDPKLNDSRRDYHVSKPGGESKYSCACYATMHGETRRRSMCSHVMAVILCEQGKMEYVRDHVPEGKVEDAELDGNSGTLDLDTDFLEILPADHHDSFGEVRDNVISLEERRAEKGGDDRGSAQHESDALPSSALPTNHPMLGDPPLPDQFASIYDYQWGAVRDMWDAAREGYEVLMLGAPTGSGKTLLGDVWRRLQPLAVNKQNAQAVYSCTTKSLQAQILRDFGEYGREIKGRANYPTVFRSDLTADDCEATPDNTSCSWCPAMSVCPYNVAKGEAARSPLPILNTAYLLAETSNPKSPFRGRELAIFDEGDLLESSLMSHMEVELTHNTRSRLGIKTLPKKTVPDDWHAWIGEEVQPAISEALRQEMAQLRLLSDVQSIRRVKRLANLGRDVGRLLSADVHDGKQWVLNMTGEKQPNLLFKPIRVDQWADGLLWGRFRNFLIMSATLISPAQLAVDLGLPKDSWAAIDVPSQFPPENRPVIYRGVAANTYSNKDHAYPAIAEEVAAIVDENPGCRILVHTVSYHLNKFIFEHVKHPRLMTYWSARYRDATLKKFLDTRDGVLLAPSFERGIDLPGEDCEVIIIAKVPYPNKGDKQVNARLYSYGGEKWYSVQTVRSIVQMTGRGMRHKNDWCDTYILDTSFKRLLKENKRLFPSWWLEALVENPHRPRTRHLYEAAKGRVEARQKKYG